MSSVLDFEFKDIDWGEDEASDDYILKDSFVEIPHFNEVLLGKKIYIIGRKGTGKTAILEKIKLMAEIDPTIFHSNISLRDFPLNDFRGTGNSSYSDKSKYVPTWKFLILVELAKLIILDNSIPETTEKEELRLFIQENFPHNLGMAETITLLKSKENKISFNTKLLSSGVTGNVATTEHQSRFVPIHFNIATKHLEDVIKHFCTESRYYILADQLDEGYKSTDKNLRLIILSLLRATEEIRKLFRGYRINCIPIVALRSDIFDNLEDNDLNKLDDYILRLEWTTTPNHEWALKQIVEKRIEASFKAKFPTLNTVEYDKGFFWDLVFDEISAPEGLWKYLCILTFTRPRDIIKLLKYCSENITAGQQRLTFKDVQAIEENFSAWFYREFRDEVQSFLPCWRSVLNCLSEIASGKAETTLLIERLLGNPQVKGWLDNNNSDAQDIVEMLFNYSVIGCINNKGRWIFKYKDESFFEYMPSYPYYCIHYGFCRKLRIVKNYDREILAEIYYTSK